MHYGYRPVLLETFVELPRFRGTCYRAANWKLLGETKGRGKLDGHNRASLPKKAIWVYPLVKNFRNVLCACPVTGSHRTDTPRDPHRCHAHKIARAARTF